MFADGHVVVLLCYILMWNA